MSDNQLFVDICIITFKRPSLLLATLSSLASQKIDNVRMRIIVIDNDREESARHTVESFNKQVPFDVIYDVEPVQSIPRSRNRTISHLKGDYCAFIDDDETVTPYWLLTMFATLKKYNADVVFGPVLGILPDDAPAWAKKHPCFDRPRRASGTPMKTGGTGNVLICKAALGQPPQIFDNAYDLTGGSDTDFFTRLYNAGKRMVWCDEAPAYESVPPERISVSWVCRRSFRSGQGFARLHSSVVHKVGWGMYKALQCLGSLILLPFSRILSYKHYVNLLCICCAALGCLAVFIFGNIYLYKEYGTNHYRQDSIE